MRTGLSLTLTVVLAATLSACAGMPRKGAAQQSQVLGAHTDMVETLPGIVDGSRITALSVVRAFDDGGRVGVCGAAVLAAPYDRLEELKRHLADNATYLELAPDSGQTLKVAARFMRPYALPVANGVLDAKAVDYTSLVGSCIRVDAPWQPAYAVSSHLELRRTLTAMTELPFVYVQAK